MRLQQLVSPLPKPNYILSDISRYVVSLDLFEYSVQ